MRRPDLLSKLIVYTFALIGLIFIIFSLSFYFVYGNEKIQSVIFNVYSQDSRMFLCAIVFCCVLVIFVPLYNIANTELLERIGWIGKLVGDGTGDKNRTAVVIFRIISFLFFSAIAMSTDEITIVLNLAGGLVIPIISFYIPVSSILQSTF